MPKSMGTLSKALALLISVFACLGCAQLPPQYIPPSDPEAASVKITSDYFTYNQGFFLHGEDPCDFNQVRTIGIVESRTIGVPTVKELNTKVPCGKAVIISTYLFSAQSEGVYLKTTGWRPIFTLDPKPGRHYWLRFNARSAELFVLADEGKPGSWIPSTDGREGSICATIYFGPDRKG